MKKIIALILSMATVLSLSACGAGGVVSKANDLLEARRVDDMIADLGGTVTLESEDAIVAAEEAYRLLTDEQKALMEYADFLPIYRNNLDILKHEAEYESLKSRLYGAWINLYDAEEPTVIIRDDGTATIGPLDYDWTLNQNLETIRFEGPGLIVLAVRDHDGLLSLFNPDLMTCIRQEDYDSFASDALVTVDFENESPDEYFGEVLDLGALADKDGKETGARLFAFRSKAYEQGLVYFHTGILFALNYKGSGKVHGVLYEPYGSYYVTDAKQLASLKISYINGSITYIRKEYISDIHFDPETGERVISLKNGIELRTSSSMNPSYKGVSFNVFDYLADGQYGF